MGTTNRNDLAALLYDEVLTRRKHGSTRDTVKSHGRESGARGEVMRSAKGLLLPQTNRRLAMKQIIENLSRFGEDRL